MSKTRLGGRTFLVLAGMAGFAAGALAQSAGNVEVYKADGSLQCTSGVALDQMAKELTGAGIAVVAMRKADDGLLHIALCGSATGAINVFTVAVPALDKAKALGFAALPAAGKP